MGTRITIAIMGSKKDRHVTSLQLELEKRGCRVPCLDFKSFPRFSILNLFPDATYDDITVREILSLNKIDLLLIRNIPMSIPQPVSRDSFIATTRLERNRTLLKYCTIAKYTRKIPVVNTLEAAMYHRLKAYQYYILHRNGITVPKTLVTCSLSDARRFAEQFDDQVIAKPNASAAEVVMADERFFELNKAILPNRPFIFQQFVSGNSYRCYLLGGRVVSCGRLFFDRTHVDWREKVDRAEPCTLDSSVERELVRAVRLLQLAYCAVDIEYDRKTGKYYFLDFNPGGLFAGWSRTMGINMAAQIAEYLIEVVKNDGVIWR